MFSKDMTVYYVEQNEYSQLLFYKEMLIMSQIAYRIHGDDASLSILKRSQFFYDEEYKKVRGKTDSVVVVRSEIDFENTLQMILG